MLLAQEMPALYSALEVLVTLAHSGALWMYLAGLRQPKILPEYCQPSNGGHFQSYVPEQAHRWERQ